MDDIPVEKIIRSRRRTLSLEVTSAATVIVRAPLRASTSYIEETIRQKSAWILRKFDEMKRRPPSTCHEYIEGELFLFLGQPDHSKLFWAKVRKIIPDYERRRKWFHENERLLKI